SVSVQFFLSPLCQQNERTPISRGWSAGGAALCERGENEKDFSSPREKRAMHQRPARAAERRQSTNSRITSSTAPPPHSHQSGPGGAGGGTWAPGCRAAPPRSGASTAPPRGGA